MPSLLPPSIPINDASVLEARLDVVADRLARARRVLFITGAGISVDSGLPTYRGIGGLYEGKLTSEGLRIEEALSGEVFTRWPTVTWKYLAQIEQTCRNAWPNAAHRAIAALDHYLERVMVLTQNVDGLHRLAGTRGLLEIHGNLQQLVCTRCQYGEEAADFCGRSLPPLCPVCAAVLRPTVVLFGEALPEEVLLRLYEAQDEGFDLVFSIGTSSTFPYIVQPVLEALEKGIPTVEINPQETTISDLVDYYLPIGAAQAMTAIIDRLGLVLDET